MGLVAFKGGLLSQSLESQYGGSARRSPPNQDGIVHWYDFSDLTTLYTDAGLTTNATAHEDEIAAMTDKGYGGDVLYSGASTDPEVDLTTHIRPSALFLNQTMNADTEVNSGIVAPLVAPWTCMAIAATEQTGNVQYVTYWSSLAWTSVAITAGDVVYTHGSGDPSTGTVSADTVFAAIAHWDEAASVVDHIYNLDAASVAETNAAAAIAANRTMRIGASTAAASVEDFGGNIMEIIWWDHSLNGSDLNAAKDYAATKWGVVWA